MLDSASLPIVDISPYLLSEFTFPPTTAQLACSRSIHAACISHGFFYVQGLGLSASDLSSVLLAAKQFFDLPNTKKQPLSIASETNGSDGARGWQRLNENITGGLADHHEGLDFYRPVQEDSRRPLHGRNQWPEECDVRGFRETFERWIDKMNIIGRAMVLATGIGLGMDEAELNELLSMVNSSFWVARIIGYPKLPEHHVGASCGAHKE
ncbi:MAG: hypothetical protein CYPHOPRED_003130 [Cyphobasidiales sp. Tagirdzhanova-0007]|nr:MAG: hypothetical protein CYPHOPRED_003130 [Cyphobasidiales sp. Tagirdzhanova-0007]